MVFSRWELQREANIAKNRALLESLNLSTPVVPPSTKSASKKRKLVSDPNDNNHDTPRKVQRKATLSEKLELPGTLRRSARNSGRAVDYRSEFHTGKLPREVRASGLSKGSGHDALNFVDMQGDTQDVGNKLGKREHNPKTFGNIPGVLVGTWWETRAQCSTAAIHAPWVAGIAGKADVGAWSVALSGGYEDDVDLGYAFTFTGCGGRDLKGTKDHPKNLRTAPQSCDQTFDNNLNKALQTSCKTRKPVRVIRGFKLKSRFAPPQGYRYDGLYVVEKAWMEPGLNDGQYKVCKFAFKRLPGQPAIPELNLEDLETQSAQDD